MVKMGKSFVIVRSMIFVIIFALVLAFVPLAFYQGNIITSLFLSIGMFVASLVGAWFLLFLVKRD